MTAPTYRDLSDYRPSMTNAVRDGLGAIDKLIKDVASAGLYGKYVNELAALRNQYNAGIVGPFNSNTTGEFPFHKEPYSKDEYNAFVYFLEQGYLARVRAFYKMIHATVSDGSVILLPNGTLLSPGVGRGGGGLPGALGGLVDGSSLGGIGGGRSGRGPGGSQFLPGLGFFPGAGPGPEGPPGGLGAPGPWNGGGHKKAVDGGTGPQSNDGGERKRTGSGSDGGGGRTGGLGEGSADTHNQVLKSDMELECGTSTYDFGVVICTPPDDSGRPSDDGGGGGADEGPRIKKGGPYFAPHASGVGRVAPGGLPVTIPGQSLSYLDFLHKSVGPSDDGWGGNNPVVRPGDLIKPADDSTGPYNPKGTDYRPAPDDPSPGGPAGAVGRVAVRVRAIRG